jgi:hypothetical protein
LQSGHFPRNTLRSDASTKTVDLDRLGGTGNLANILIVESDPAVQMAIRLLPERAGHDVSLAGGGLEGRRPWDRRSGLLSPRVFRLKAARRRA